MVRIKDHGYVTALREIKHLKSGIRKVKHKPHNSKRKPGATPHTEKDHLKRMNRELERLNRKVKSSKSEIETLEKKLKLADAARLRSEKVKRKMEAQNERHCLLAKRCMRETIRLRTTYHLDSDDEASTSDDSEIEQYNRLNRRAVSLRHQPIAKEGM
jgi:chromosome segregation ATPase